MTTPPEPRVVATEARYLLRSASKGALATLQQQGGAPLATLVTVATDPFGAPLLLLSDLAWHTRNIQTDPRASLLIDGTEPEDDPLQGSRVSLWGKMHRLDAEAAASARARFLGHHPEAAYYADFKDFSFYRLAVEGGHSVAGFGRIVTFDAEDFLLSSEQFAAIADAEMAVIEHMNDDHADAVALYATKLLGLAPGEWTLSACDPDGCAVAGDNRAFRLPFDQTAQSREEIRKALVSLVHKARAMEAA